MHLDVKFCFIGHSCILNSCCLVDLAVGAPYGGEDGRGAVYIYHGSMRGIITDIQQVGLKLSDWVGYLEKYSCSCTKACLWVPF